MERTFRPHQNCRAVSFGQCLLLREEQTPSRHRKPGAIDPQQRLGESNGLDYHRHRPRRELLNQVRLFFRNISPGGSNSTTHLLGLFCCYTKLISQKFGLQLHHFVYVLGIH
jgi:hypothetical protein